jgi:polyisoprenoid-binding protein YceI
MIHKIILAISILSIIICDIYKIDSDKSKIYWIGRKITGEHNGTINIKDGYVDINQGSITSGLFEIDMNSIDVLDMSEKYNKKLESHLKNPDFFDVENFPVSTFKINKSYNFFLIDNIVFEGDLKIKSTLIKKNIPATISVNDSTAEAVGVIDIDRTLFGITYGSSSFFDNLVRE